MDIFRHWQCKLAKNSIEVGCVRHQNLHLYHLIKIRYRERIQPTVIKKKRVLQPWVYKIIDTKLIITGLIN